MAKDSQWQFEHTIGRWGHRQESAKRAARKLAHELQRRRGGRPRAEERTGRWRAMYEGRDPELESMLDPGLDGENGLSRYRLLVWLDWQRHAEDWKRDRYPASRTHPGEIDPAFLRAGEDRVRKALGKRLQTP
jgi:hypothetical protein